MERPDLQQDPRFATKRGREENYPNLHALMSAQAKLHPRDYWLERLEARDVPALPIHALADVFADPVVAELGMLHEVADTWDTKWKLVGSALLSDTPVTPPVRAPLMGEHSRSILESIGATELTTTAPRCIASISMVARRPAPRRRLDTPEPQARR